ncbi:MAG: hypothetical protein Q9174_006104 [Haloplaca sp. 1 TL-2023]
MASYNRIQDNMAGYSAPARAAAQPPLGLGPPPPPSLRERIAARIPKKLRNLYRRFNPKTAPIEQLDQLADSAEVTKRVTEMGLISEPKPEESDRIRLLAPSPTGSS